MAQNDGHEAYVHAAGLPFGASRSPKPFAITGTLGVGYTSTRGIEPGGTLYGYYYTGLRTPYLSPSYVSVFGDVSFKGYYIVGINGKTFFRNDDIRIDYLTYISHMPADFWGFGFDNARRRDPQRFNRTNVYFKADFLRRIAPRSYVGIDLSFASNRGSLDDLSYLDGQKIRSNIPGIGAIITYDSYRLPVKRRRGVSLMLNPRVYPRFQRIEAVADIYHDLGRTTMVAFDFHADIGFGHIPWPYYPAMGTISRMRGYYMGHYRDRNLAEAQLEIRQHLFWHVGVAAWAGCGNSFQSFNAFDPSHTLPNWGAGIRWQFTPDLLVRFDFGMGRNTNGFMIAVGEAF